MRFSIPGEPCGKARPRVVRQGNFSRAYTPEKTVSYENLVKLEYQQQCGDKFFEECALHMNITARFAIPNSASKRKAMAMLDGKIRPTKKPDCDNIVKIICDALNKIAYRDDAQIVSISIEKRFAIMPGVDVEILEVAV